VQIARNGTEARSDRRAYPRHTYSFEIYATSAIARACLEALRTESTFSVPLWPHVFERPDLASDVAVYGPASVLQLDQLTGAYAAGSGAFAWDAAYSIAAPLAVARFAGSQRSISHVLAGKIATAQVSFRLEDFRENAGPYWGPTSSTYEEMVLFDVFTESGGGLAEQINDDSNTFENGHRDLYESRFRERVYTANVVLNTRAKILAFRQMLFLVKGRLTPLRWTAPGDTVERTWRLASDTVELAYTRPSYATCTLSLKQIPDPS